MEYIFTRNNTNYTLRNLIPTDAQTLATFFTELDPITRQRFGPHPLTPEFAAELCTRTHDTAYRLVIVETDKNRIVGYMILEREVPWYEIERYRNAGISIEAHTDASFAPCIHPDVQNSGIASACMPQIIAFAQGEGLRNLVLLGGTQDTNKTALRFYEKFGFTRCGGYHTEVFNHDMMLRL